MKCNALRPLLEKDANILHYLEPLAAQGRFSGGDGFGRAVKDCSLLVRCTPYVVTLDMLMDGWSVLTTLKSDPDLAHIPLVMLTMVDNKKTAYALGVAPPLIPILRRLAPATDLEELVACRPG